MEIAQQQQSQAQELLRQQEQQQESENLAQLQLQQQQLELQRQQQQLEIHSRQQLPTVDLENTLQYIHHSDLFNEFTGDNNVLNNDPLLFDVSFNNDILHTTTFDDVNEYFMDVGGHEVIEEEHVIDNEMQDDNGYRY